jgi:hypothetical protein
MDDPASGFWPLPFAPLQALLDYWIAKRGSRRCPDKSDIDPTEIGPLLANIILLDAAPPGGEFRYRLAGTRVTQMVGRELRGLTQRELHDNASDPAMVQAFARIETEYAWIGRAFTGGFRTSRLAVPRRDHVELARLILPLSAVDGAARHMVMIMIDIGASPKAARLVGGVEFGVDLDRLVPIPLPPEVSALSPPSYSWSLPRTGTTR